MPRNGDAVDRFWWCVNGERSGPRKFEPAPPVTFLLEKRLLSRDGRLALIENVVEGFGARTAAQARRLRGRRLEEPGVKTEGSGHEHFEELFLAHYSRIVAVLQRVVGDFGRAEELASEVFLKLYRKPLAEWPEGNVPGWLYRTATNLGIDELRATARRHRLEQSAAVSGGPVRVAENGLDRMLRSERRQRVRGILADLKAGAGADAAVTSCGPFLQGAGGGIGCGARVGGDAAGPRGSSIRR